MEICTKHQIILERLKRTITTLIQKEPGSPFIHRMRAIHIIETEVQFLEKYNYVHQMMGLAEKSNLITTPFPKNKSETVFSPKNLPILNCLRAVLTRSGMSRNFAEKKINSLFSVPKKNPKSHND